MASSFLFLSFRLDQLAPPPTPPPHPKHPFLLLETHKKDTHPTACCCSLSCTWYCFTDGSKCFLSSSSSSHSSHPFLKKALKKAPKNTNQTPPPVVFFSRARFALYCPQTKNNEAAAEEGSIQRYVRSNKTVSYYPSVQSSIRLGVLREGSKEGGRGGGSGVEELREGGRSREPNH